MSEGQILGLGAIAGATILLGLPIGRLNKPVPRLRQFLNAVAIGILIFLIWDVLSQAYEPLDNSLRNLHDGTGSSWTVVGYGALFLGGIGVGLLSLVYYERFLQRRHVRLFGPGAMAVEEARARPATSIGLTDPRRLALLVAIGIGLHNLGEGLAIGASAAKGATTLATLLVIGFALHNATEGFGIVAPLATEEERPTWAFLALLALIGGGPTFVGTAIGSQFTSDPVNVVFLTLAAGSILYVVIQLLNVAQKAGYRQLLAWGIFLGLVAGFATDMVVSAAGA